MTFQDFLHSITWYTYKVTPSYTKSLFGRVFRTSSSHRPINHLTIEERENHLPVLRKFLRERERVVPIMTFIIMTEEMYQENVDDNDRI